ncbi:fibrillarin-like rRNA/tRNA 2'-O-methyltransferase [Candidatus Woesearchaeota archaeon]|nr:fibrillarin-like rRNA/tRNA 2'-O-methyltransferase [Candidatus Woesearchaeota archaeon]
MIPNFVKRKRKLWTLNSVPGKKTTFDRTEKFEGQEYREWDPRRSKYAAAIVQRLKNEALKQDSTVLYLGASHGYTVSFFSDICSKGILYALDFAPRVMRDLVYVCIDRKNIIPILGDASKPEMYFHKCGSCDIVYMDIAQKDQAKIFLDNVQLFLRKGGIGFLALKAKSVDVTAKPEKIYKQVEDKLRNEVRILEKIKLDPFQKDHCMFVIQKS